MLLIGEVLAAVSFFSCWADASFTLNEDFSDSLNEEFEAIALLSNNTCPSSSKIDMQGLMSNLLLVTAKNIQKEPDFKMPFIVNCSVLFNQRVEKIHCDTVFKDVENLSNAHKGVLTDNDEHILHKYNILKTSITVGLAPIEHPVAEYFLYFKSLSTKSESKSISEAQTETSLPIKTNSLIETPTEALIDTKSDSMLESASSSLTPTSSKTITVQDAAGGIKWPLSVYADGTNQVGRYEIIGSGANSVVKDSLTNLQWEQKVSGTSVTWSSTAAAGSAQSYCGNLTKGGHTDWRLPTPIELQSLVDYTIDYHGPTINSAIFSAITTSYYYTSLLVAGSKIPWYVSFGSTACYGGLVYAQYPGWSNCAPFNGYSWCVRGQDYSLPIRFTDENGNALISGSTQVKDQMTGLIWQRTQAGSTMTWSTASSYCSNLALGGQSWRLPTIKELGTLVDYTIAPPGPTINISTFPSTASNGFWSSTVVAGSPSFAWYVGFSYGNVYFYGVVRYSLCPLCSLMGY